MAPSANASASDGSAGPSTARTRLAEGRSRSTGSSAGCGTVSVRISCVVMRMLIESHADCSVVSLCIAAVRSTRPLLIAPSVVLMSASAVPCASAMAVRGR